MTKKEKAISFLQLTFSGKPREAFDKFTSDELFHRNQYFSGNREAMIKAIEDSHRASPNKSIEVEYCFEDGDSVITYSLVTKQKVEINAIHNFRFSGNKIVDVWDLWWSDV
jgi:predicted SnoaL-like aldol condensation-catalyzing enzyme